MLKRIYEMLSPDDRKSCLKVGLSVFVRSILDFAGIAALMPVVALLLGDNPGGARAMMLCVAVLVFILLKNGICILIIRYQTGFLLRLYRKLSLRMFYTYYHKGLLFLKNHSTAQLANEVNFVCYAFSLNILQPITQMLGTSVLIVLLAVALSVWQPLAGLILFIAILPAGYLYVRLLRQRIRRSGKEEIVARRSQDRMVIEAFRGYSELEVSDAYNMIENTFLNGVDAINRSRMRLETVQSVPPLISEVAIVVCMAVLLFFSQGDMKVVGGMFAIVAFRLMYSVRSMFSDWTLLRNNSYCVDIIADAICDSQGNQSEQIPALSFRHDIVAENIRFAFPDSATDIFNNLSFRILKGERIGVKGVSGSGKSTLLNIMLGFYPVSEGRIVIDGQPLKQEMLKSWHRLIGYVPQEVFIINGDLAQNIALGQENIDEDRIWDVLEQVQLKDWAESLPDGLYTSLGEYGSRLSGGQKQRVGIARALYKQAEVLLFDEATSSLDSETEREVNNAIQQLSESCREITMVIIAHRESSLSFCHRIIELK
ncbi:MAG: ABC transporter ATP-binding protein/permease [Bacteroidales bacterium]|nr:ABC transporter ATP-binding protein/permease [Bacteroidales bacterium]